MSIPEAPWPHLDDLARRTDASGKLLVSGCPPSSGLRAGPGALARPEIAHPVLRAIDGKGLARADAWCPGAGTRRRAIYLSPALFRKREREGGGGPPSDGDHLASPAGRVPSPRKRGEGRGEGLLAILDRAVAGGGAAEAEILSAVRHGDEFEAVCDAADRLRRRCWATPSPTS